MDYVPVTPFRRMVDAAHLKRQQLLEKETPPTGVNKWEALRELSAGREAFGLSDRDLTVLQALLSFHPETILGGNSADPVVYPSNRAICERLNGMPCSTMRRHLGNLVQAGILLRRDSPNGKRYARQSGEEKIAFGFDLTPLLVRHAEFCAAAEKIREAQDRFRRLREAVSLMRRDLAGLAAYGAEIRPDMPVWNEFLDLAALVGRTLRRKLLIGDVEMLHDELRIALDHARDILEPRDSENMSSNDAISEHHYQNSNPNLNDLELRQEKAKAAAVEPDPNGVPVDADPPEEDSPALPYETNRLPNLPLGLVVQVCTEVLTYADGPVRHWHEFVRLADIVRPMMGISPSAWDEAKRVMGPEEAAVVLAAMLQRFTEIKSPGGYLRHLTVKAETGGFSCGPMVMALMRRDAA